MYKLGNPTKRRIYRAWLGIVLIVTALVGAFYFLIVRQSHQTVRNNNSPLITKVGNDGQISLTIKEPLFTMQLPGQWKETSRDSNPRYQTIQWNYNTKDAANRWVRIYIDSIPADFAINYLLPVKPNDKGISVGQISDNCVTFTQGATVGTNRDVSTPISREALPARWQGTSFMCDNSHVSHQVVGTGSDEGNNMVSITGSEHGKHKYFFVYEDDNYHPDYSIFMNILESFRAK
jgi:hypothetical protein